MRVGIEAGHQRGQRRPAQRSRDVATREDRTGLGQRVEIRCLDRLVSHEPEISPRLIVADDEHYVRLLRALWRRTRSERVPVVRPARGVAPGVGAGPETIESFAVGRVGNEVFELLGIAVEIVEKLVDGLLLEVARVNHPLVPHPLVLRDIAAELHKVFDEKLSSPIRQLDPSREREHTVPLIGHRLINASNVQNRCRNVYVERHAVGRLAAGAGSTPWVADDEWHT